MLHDSLLHVSATSRDTTLEDGDVRSSLQEQEHASHHTSSSRSEAIFLLANSAVGAGVLSIPLVFANEGLLGGFLLLLFVAVFEALTLIVIFSEAHVTDSHSYGDLVRKKLGPSMSNALNLSKIVYLFGSAVAYLIILGDSMAELWKYCTYYILGDTCEWCMSRQACICFISILFIFPQCLKKTLGGSNFISLVNMFAFAGIILCIVLYSISHIVDLEPEKRFDGVSMFFPQTDQGSILSSVYVGLALSVFAFQCHAQVVSVFHELESSSNAPIPAYVRKLSSIMGFKRDTSMTCYTMVDVVVKTMGLCWMGYSLVGSVAYAAFPKSIKGNIFNTFGYDNLLVSGARIIVGLIQIASYPVNHFPTRKAVAGLFHMNDRQTKQDKFVYIETSIFFFASLGVSLTQSEVGEVLGLVGGVAGSMIIFVVPGCLLTYGGFYGDISQRKHISLAIAGISLVLFGVSLLFYTIYSVST